MRALDKHEIVLVTGGPEVDVPLPDHVRRYQLPVLRMQSDKKLISDDGSPTESIWPERVARLQDLFRREAPDVFLVELYPLGRTAFGRELDTILAGIRLGRLPDCRVYCSVRDILVEKRNPATYENRVCRDLNRWFDALLVHSDPALVTLDDTFGAIEDIAIPVVYTGYVAPPAPKSMTREAFRLHKGIDPGETLIVVSAGGGQSGYPLLKAMLAVYDQLAAKIRMKITVFTGPYLPDDQLAKLQKAATPGVAVERFSAEFTAWLAAADVSVSMAGYNTCMSLLTSGVPALVWPFEGDREQPLRAARLAAADCLSVLRREDLDPQRLSMHIEDALRRNRRPIAPVDLEGARKTARFIQSHRPQRKRPRTGRPPMKIVVYCQHLLGIGHLFRTREICRALDAHDVVLVTGGLETPIPLPANVRHRQLPELATNREFQNLHSPRGDSLESTRAERRQCLRAILREEAPDMFLIELYPIGRKAFRFELDPLLAEIDAGRLPDCKVVCSVRDILVEKEDALKHETRAVDTLNRWFDALLVHADPEVVRLEETFGRTADIRVPVVYTGFVAPPQAPMENRDAWRTARGIAADQKVVVVSAGGGAVGYPLLEAAVHAARHLPMDGSIQVQVFTGPYLPEDEGRALRRNLDPRVRIDRFAEDFPAWLQAADLSISMAGYNTCMTIMTTGVRALVHPFAFNREQGLRARLLEDRGLLGVLSATDLNPPSLAERIVRELEAPGRKGPCAVDIAGAANTARWIEYAFAKGTFS